MITSIYINKIGERELNLSAYIKPNNWSQLDTKEIFDFFEVEPDTGLTSTEVQKRLLEHGPNTLRQQTSASNLKIFWQQLKSIIVLILFIACIVSLLLGDRYEAFAIFLVLVVNTFIGFVIELKATRSMEALRKLGHVTTSVLRNGELIQNAAENLVPGDIAYFEGGDIITADLRIFECSRLTVDESTLTGEAFPIEKNALRMNDNPPLAERVNMLFKGTSVTNGSGKAIVVATGMNTELGKVAKLTFDAKEEITPLEKKLAKLGQRLAFLSLVLVAIIAFLGIFRGKDPIFMLEIAVALAIAAIPEGLPIVATIALARGMWRMAKKNALVNKLSAVETLGATTIILCDKTGTLTENKMSVAAISQHEGSYTVNSNSKKFLLNDEEIEIEKPTSPLIKAINVSVLCNNAYLGEGESSVGDPMELALLQAGLQLGIRREQLIEHYPEYKEESFDPATRMMATTHKIEDSFLVAVKGAPESVLKKSTTILTANNNMELTDELKKHWHAENDRLASEGLRVIALASKIVKNGSTEPYSELNFLGLVGLIDPPRKGVKEAILKCIEAGVKVIMVTGDQLNTAKAIARQIGIKSTDIHSRISPTGKLEIVQQFQNDGEVVAMTGDGVNDAPALKKADIGVAMGGRGTQVAREAADIVLKDDNFTSIIASIFQGRVIFTNIRRFVVYLLSCNISEVLIVFFATALGSNLPILPFQILFLNLVTDVFPALALGMGEGDASYMKMKPRNPREAMITKKLWLTISGYGLLMTASVLMSFYSSSIWLNASASKSVTIAFFTLAFAQVFHVFNMRDYKSEFLINDVTKNIHVWGAVFFCIFLLFMCTKSEILRNTLELVELTQKEWTWIALWSFCPLVIVQLSKVVSKQIYAFSSRKKNVLKAI